MAYELTILTPSREAAEHVLRVLRLDMVAAQSRESIVRLDQGEEVEWCLQTVVADRELCLESLAKWAAIGVEEFPPYSTGNARFREIGGTDDEHASRDARDSMNLWVAPVWPDFSPIVNGDNGQTVAVQHLGITEMSVNTLGEYAWLWFSERMREWMRMHELVAGIVCETRDLQDSRSLEAMSNPKWPSGAIKDLVAYVDSLGETIAKDLARVSGRQIGYTTLESSIL